MKALRTNILVTMSVVLTACQQPDPNNQTAVSDPRRQTDVSQDLPDDVDAESKAVGLTSYMLRGARPDKGTVLAFVDLSTGNYVATSNLNTPELSEVIVASGSQEEFASQLEGDEFVRFGIMAAQHVDSSARNLRLLTPEEIVSLRRRLAR